MTVSRDPPFVDVYCDGCSVGCHRYQAPDALGALFMADHDGWDVDQDSSGRPRIDGRHLCPDCVEETT